MILFWICCNAANRFVKLHPIRKEISTMQKKTLLWLLSICICTFHIRMLEKGSIGVYNCIRGEKWIFRLLNI